MALPDSGPISIDQIKTSIPSNTNNVRGLFSEADENLIKAPGDNIAPDSLSEFYGYPNIVPGAYSVWVAADDTVYVSHNEGLNFVTAFKNTSKINVMTDVHFATEFLGYIGGYKTDVGPVLHWTPDKGSTWIDRTSNFQGGLHSQARIVDIHFAENNSNIGYIATGSINDDSAPSDIYQTIDGGNNFIKLSGANKAGLPRSRYTSVHCGPDGYPIIAGHSFGDVFYSFRGTDTTILQASDAGMWPDKDLSNNPISTPKFVGGVWVANTRYPNAPAFDTNFDSWAIYYINVIIQDNSGNYMNLMYQLNRNEEGISAQWKRNHNSDVAILPSYGLDGLYEYPGKMTVARMASQSHINANVGHGQSGAGAGEFNRKYKDINLWQSTDADGTQTDKYVYDIASYSFTDDNFKIHVLYRDPNTNVGIVRKYQEQTAAFFGVPLSETNFTNPVGISIAPINLSLTATTTTTSTTTTTTTIPPTPVEGGYTVWVTAENKIFRAIDDGVTYIEIPSPTTNTLRDIHFVDKYTGYLSASGPILYKTTDSGNTWTDITSNVFPVSAPSPHVEIVDIHFAIDNNGIGYIAAGGLGSTGAPSYLFKTTDGGDSWTQELYRASLTRSRYTSVHCGRSGYPVIAGHSFGDITHTYDGASWRTFQSINAPTWPSVNSIGQPISTPKYIGGVWIANTSYPTVAPAFDDQHDSNAIYYASVIAQTNGGSYDNYIYALDRTVGGIGAKWTADQHIFAPNTVPYNLLGDPEYPGKLSAMPKLGVSGIYGFTGIGGSTNGWINHMVFGGDTWEVKQLQPTPTSDYSYDVGINNNGGGSNLYAHLLFKNPSTGQGFVNRHFVPGNPFNETPLTTTVFTNPSSITVAPVDDQWTTTTTTTTTSTTTTTTTTLPQLGTPDLYELVPTPGPCEDRATWYAVSNTVTYIIQYGLSASFDVYLTEEYQIVAPIISGIVIAGDGEGTYYGRVKATAPGYLDSNWSNVRSLYSPGCF